MNSNIVPEKTFEQKMSEKIRESIGDLLSTDDLNVLVKRSIEEVFFAPRKNPNKTYSSRYDEPETIQPLIHSIVKEVLSPIVKEVVSDYVKEHNEEILNIVKTVVTNGVGNAVISAMNLQFQNQLISFQSSIQAQLFK